MDTNKLKVSTDPSQWLFYFLVFQTIIWTVGPALDRHSLPHDMLEAMSMGFQCQWGYNKHPFLSPWLTAFVGHLPHTTDWPMYCLSQCAVVVTFYCVWKLANFMLPPRHALIATCLLAGSLFNNFYSINFTPDTLQTPLWAMFYLFSYRALTTQTVKSWCFVGVAAGLCLLTKYQVIVVFLSMLLFCICNQAARQSFKKIGIYAGVGTFLIVISPHLVWLYQHDFITLHYALESPSRYLNTAGHVVYPLRLIIGSIASVACGLILLLPLFFVRRDTRESEKKLHSPFVLTRFQWQFLLYLGLGPWCLTILICAIFGNYFPPRWLTPYPILWGILTVAWLKPKLTDRKYRAFLITTYLLSTILCVLPFFSVPSKLKSDAYLPNPEIAKTLETIWQQRYATPLTYLAGSRYLVASVTPYFKKPPIPYFSWDKQSSPWIQEEEIKKQGALFIWDEGRNYIWDDESLRCPDLPRTIQQRYPRLQRLGCYQFYRQTSETKPVVIGVAVLPPRV